MPPTTDLSDQLARRAAHALTAAGWREYDASAPPSECRFGVTPGFGATVSLAWMDATPEQRLIVLTSMFVTLADAGLVAQLRDNVIYLPLNGNPK